MGALKNLLYREIGIQRVTQFVAKLVLANSEVSVRFGQQFLFKPDAVRLKRSNHLRLNRGKLRNQLRHLVKIGLQLLPNEADIAFVLQDGGFGMHPRGIFEIQSGRLPAPLVWL